MILIYFENRLFLFGVTPNFVKRRGTKSNKSFDGYADSSLTDTSPRTVPRLSLSQRTLRRRTFPRTDISPNGQFPDRKLPGLDISPTGHFPNRTFPLTTCFSEIFFKSNFLSVCTRIYQTVIQSCDLDQL